MNGKESARATVAFLDDAATRTFTVDRGQPSGIVDTGAVCFGDPLYALGLTRMALSSEGLPATCADAWAEALDAGDAARAAVEFDPAVFCVDFLSELGQRFNRDGAPQPQPRRVAALQRILDEPLSRLDRLTGALR